METIRIEVPELRIEVTSRYKSPIDDEDCVGFGLHLGNSLVLRGWSLGKEQNEARTKEDNKRWFSLSDSAAPFRLLDVPLNHKSDPDYQDETQLLSYILNKAIHDFLLTEDGESLKSYLNEGGEIPTFDSFTPDDWAGALQIPIQYVKVAHMQTGAREEYRNVVFANIYLGHHVVFWTQTIYDPASSTPLGSQNQVILDVSVQEILTHFLEDHREQLKIMSENGADGLNFEGWRVVSNEYDPDSQIPPPVVFVKG